MKRWFQRRGLLLALCATAVLNVGTTHAEQYVPIPADPIVRDNCHRSNAFPLDGISADFADLLPSTKKFLAGVARQALKDGCMFDLTCVSPTKEREARLEARRPCAATARALTLGVPRGPLRNAMLKSMTIRVVNYNAEKQEFAVGKVYVNFFEGGIDRSKITLSTPRSNSLTRR